LYILLGCFDKRQRKKNIAKKQEYVRDNKNAAQGRERARKKEEKTSARCTHDVTSKSVHSLGSSSGGGGRSRGHVLLRRLRRRLRGAGLGAGLFRRLVFGATGRAAMVRRLGGRVALGARRETWRRQRLEARRKAQLGREVREEAQQETQVDATHSVASEIASRKIRILI